METVELAAGIFHLRGGSNMGLVVREGKGLLIDTGLDKDSGRRALRVIDELGVTLEGVILTHAHADHFGGAQAIQRRREVTVYAPSLEAAMMEHPLIEPLFLFGGAAPIGDLRHKFTLAKPCRVDQVIEPGPLQVGPFETTIISLPGHAPNQVGVAVGDVLFCADAVFPAATLQKHKVIFCFDLDEMLATLDRLHELEYAIFAPGHGPVYAGGEEIVSICAANRERLEEIRECVRAALTVPQETPALVQAVSDHFGLGLATATAYLLTRTTVLAALSSLERSGLVHPLVEENRLRWRLS